MDSINLEAIVGFNTYMATYTMALKCSNAEIDAFFILAEDLLQQCNIESENIKKMLKLMHEGVLDFKQHEKTN